MTRRFFLNFDKAGAEWVVVAYLTGDANMLEVVNSGENPHVITAHKATNVPKNIIIKEKDIIQELNDPVKISALREKFIPELSDYEWLPRSFSLYQTFKKANHGLNYKEDWFKFMMDNEMEASDAKRIVCLYRGPLRDMHYDGPIVYPGISVWWNSIEEELRSNRRTLYNLLGHKREFPGMWGDDLVKSAISYKPQSTIGAMVRRGQRLIYQKMLEAARGKAPEVWRPLDLLGNVHDSLLFSYPWGRWISAAKVSLEIDKMMSPTLEAKARQFTIKTDLKVGGRSWAKMEKVEWSNNINYLAKNIKEAVLLSEKLDVKKAA
ncbi:MAG: hypothetical protein L0Y56_10795 [Nitrospira sp.]|nr:hypothetical protein [Nitrospira sp.]